MTDDELAAQIAAACRIDIEKRRRRRTRKVKSTTEAPIIPATNEITASPIGP